ncbi:hypothetical protein [Caldisphaera sp.]|uniref:hypothetical protein n=1 Tax=Caldisphaera sp. TaxID=2060322 RepID=UPI0025BCEE0B|nr:hypothetical protein [Caldisphaera sp.]
MSNNTILIDDFKNLSLKRESTFSEIFVSLVYSKDLTEFIEKYNAKKISEGKFSISLAEEYLINLFGTDVLFNRIDAEYGIFYGFTKKLNSPLMKSIKNFIRKMNI